MSRLKFLLPSFDGGCRRLRAGQKSYARPMLGIPANARIVVKEVRHELVMLPYYNVFDNLSYRVDGSTVTLTGASYPTDVEIRRRQRGEAPGRSNSGE